MSTINIVEGVVLPHYDAGYAPTTILDAPAERKEHYPMIIISVQPCSICFSRCLSRFTSSNHSLYLVNH